MRSCTHVLLSSSHALALGDIHFDPDYIPGTNINCGYPICCHGGTGDAAPFGSYGCDAPLTLLHSAFTTMAKILPDPDYIIFTGDVPVRIGPPMCC